MRDHGCPCCRPMCRNCRNARRRWACRVANLLQRVSLRHRGAARTTRSATRVASRHCGVKLRQGVGPGSVGRSILEQDGRCMLDGSTIPNPLQMCHISRWLRRGISCSPNLLSVCNPRSLQYCGEQQDVRLQIPSARSGGQKCCRCQQPGVMDSKSSIAHREACLHPINIRDMDVNGTGEPGPEQRVKSLQLRVV